MHGFCNVINLRFKNLPGGEFKSGGFALEEPGVTVGVEDALAEEVMKNSLPRRTFRVVIEAGLEHVFNVLGIGRDRHETLLLCQERHCADTCLIRSATRTEVLSDPVVHTVTLLDQTRKTPQYRPDTWTL